MKKVFSLLTRISGTRLSSAAGNNKSGESSLDFDPSDISWKALNEVMNPKINSKSRNRKPLVETGNLMASQSQFCFKTTAINTEESDSDDDDICTNPIYKTIKEKGLKSNPQVVSMVKDIASFLLHIPLPYLQRLSENKNLNCQKALVAYDNEEERTKEAFFIAGQRYENKGLYVDAALAYLEAAKKQSRDGCYRLALICRYGKGKVEKNLDHANKLTKHAAFLGHIDARHHSAVNIFSCADSNIFDLILAKYFLDENVKKNHPQSMHYLACLIFMDKVDEPLTKAIKLLQKASKMGYSSSMYNLALCYKDGLGIGENLYRCRQLLEKAIQLNHQKSIKLLAYLNKKDEVLTMCASSLENPLQEHTLLPQVVSA